MTQVLCYDCGHSLSHLYETFEKAKAKIDDGYFSSHDVTPNTTMFAAEAPAYGKILDALCLKKPCCRMALMTSISELSPITATTKRK